MIALRLFVYGTLQRGWWNHARHVPACVEATPATVRGRLYQLPSGIPILRVPDEAVLAEGGPHPREDVAVQARLGRVLALHPDLGGRVALPEAWGVVHGEVLTIADPAARLPALDRLEGFVPGAPSAYRRVVLPADVDGTPEAVWAYVWPGPEDPAPYAALLPGGRWPAGGG